MELKSFLDLKQRHWQLLVFFPLGTIVPGALVILHFRPDLYVSLDVSKLLLLSIGLTVPTLFTSVLTALPQAILQGLKKSRPDEFVDASDLYMMAGVASAFTMYTGLAAAYFWALPFRTFVGVVAALSIVLVALSWLRFYSKIER